MMTRAFMTAAAVCALSCAGVNAHAATIIYTNAANFDANSGPTTTETFEDSIFDNFDVVSDFDSVASGAFYDTVTRNLAETVFAFDYGITSFGGVFNMGPNGYGQGIRFTLLFGDGHEEEISKTVARTNSQFLGFTSDDAFTGVKISFASKVRSTNERYAMDDLRYTSPPILTARAAPPSGAPEPSTWAMLLLGFGTAGVTLRRRRAQLA